eukprot:1100908-Pyramimonas_sp.AAC.1
MLRLVLMIRVEGNAMRDDPCVDVRHPKDGDSATRQPARARKFLTVSTCPSDCFDLSCTVTRLSNVVASLYYKGACSSFARVDIPQTVFSES